MHGTKTDCERIKTEKEKKEKECTEANKYAAILSMVSIHFYTPEIDAELVNLTLSYDDVITRIIK